MTALQIILARTEKDQLGLSVAQWFAERAREHAGFDVQLVDQGDAGRVVVGEPFLGALRGWAAAIGVN